MRKILLIVLCIFNSLLSNFIPITRVVDWSNVGLYSDLPPVAENIININDYTGSDNDKIDSALSDAKDMSGYTIIYFPADIYTFTKPIMKVLFFKVQD